MEYRQLALGPGSCMVDYSALLKSCGKGIDNDRLSKKESVAIITRNDCSKLQGLLLRSVAL